MRKWFDSSKKEIVRLFIIRINGGFYVNYFLFWKVELFPPYPLYTRIGATRIILEHCYTYAHVQYILDYYF